MYEYKCIIKRVIDGDTVDVDIDLGFGVWLRGQRIRFYGIDAPETRTRDLEEKARGHVARDFVSQFLQVESVQTLISRKDETGKYGRILGDFVVYDAVWDAQRNLTELLLREGLVEVYEST